MRTYDVITVGSATRDVFMRSRAFDAHKDGPAGLECCFPLGAKIEIEEIALETGGGGTNAAATFGRLGHRTATVTAIGDDASARDIMSALKENGVSDAFVQRYPKKMTAYSVIILTGSGERIVLVHRGVSDDISMRRLPWSRAKTRWFYLTSLGGDLKLVRRLLDHAAGIGARVAWNPGSKEIRKGLKRLGPLIRQVDVFNLNREEAADLTGVDATDIKKIFRVLNGLPRRYLVVTDGRKGAYASGPEGAWRSGIVDVPRVNVTGAGDAFGSGMVAGLLRRDELPYALAVGTWNATGVVQETGAKRGLLRTYPGPAKIKRIPLKPWRYER
ncbi:hypothetical protein AMJ57_03390 [Parcubacteria bacterium SG8_24]|nr:MAG: hypothetical protein AMJ57_03390 [Parcubacteria bacterium SG8_24]